ncbi:MAG: 2OG-Fe(II) oxygenase family protein [Candidatus Nanoarchaeia archaeon]
MSQSNTIENWIHQDVLSNIEQFSQTFQNATPYEHISIPHFFKEDIAKQIEQALMSVDYEEFNTDLYHFFKSKDLKHISSLPQILQDLHTFIFSTECIELFQKLTNTSINTQKQGDLHSILLQHTHYLLCHDDQVDERSIAFIINLSRDFTKKDGGALEIFAHNSQLEPTQCEKRIIPKFNQLNMFKVSEISFHQISEVEAVDKNRLSISGWYYK